LGVEHARRTDDRSLLEPADFGHTALGRKIAFQDRKMPLRIYRIGPWTNDVLIRPRLRRNLFQHLGNRLAMDGHAATMQDAIDQQDPERLRDAAGRMEISRHKR